MSSAGRVDFASLSGEGVRVAIVDSGISPLAAPVGGLCGGVSLSLRDDGEVREWVAVTDHLGHGTACAGLIRSLAPAVALYSIRVFEEELATSGAQLVAAIDWAVDRQMQVVNLSLGTTDVATAGTLEEACQRALDAGVVLVAAESNDGMDAYPAVLSQAIGVRAGPVRSRYGYYWNDRGPIECVARGDAQRVKWLHGREVMMGGSSFAAPRIAAIAALLLEAAPGSSPAQIRSLLRDHATARSGGGRVAVSTASHGAGAGYDACRFARAVLYPFGKEMHAFVRFPDLARFRVVGAADPVGRGLVGRDTGEALGLEATGTAIRASLRQVEVPFDGLVLGHLGRLGSLRRRDLLGECLAFALDRGVHVFAFDSLAPEPYEQVRRAAGEAGLAFRWPAVTMERAAGVLAGASPHGAVDVPVVAVMGTSSAQGKFTLQLALRRELLRRGYAVGQLGTEPHSELLGMDAVFPMGYASTVQLPVDLYPEYLDRVLRRICWTRRPDLILTGSQSGTVPFDLRDHRTLTLPSLAFLMGTKPDAVVLVVNAVDPVEYIRSTIHAIRAITRADVVSLAVSDRAAAVRGPSRRLGPPHPVSQPEPGPGEAIRRLRDRLGLEVCTITDPQAVSVLVDGLVRQFSPHQQQEEETPCLPRTA